MLESAFFGIHGLSEAQVFEDGHWAIVFRIKPPFEFSLSQSFQIQKYSHFIWADISKFRENKKTHISVWADISKYRKTHISVWVDPPSLSPSSPLILLLDLVDATLEGAPAIAFEKSFLFEKMFSPPIAHLWGRKFLLRGDEGFPCIKIYRKAVGIRMMEMNQNEEQVKRTWRGRRHWGWTRVPHAPKPLHRAYWKIWQVLTVFPSFFVLILKSRTEDWKLVADLYNTSEKLNMMQSHGTQCSQTKIQSPLKECKSQPS